jgi:hypothetical protein
MTAAEHSVQESESLTGLAGRIELGDEYPLAASVSEPCGSPEFRDRGIRGQRTASSVGRSSSASTSSTPLTRSNVAYFHTAERSRCDGARAWHCR